MITVIGVLTNPMGIPEVGVTIRVESLVNDIALLGSTAEQDTDGSGNYNFTLTEGTHRIEVDFKDEYLLVGEVTITSGMNGSTYTLPELLNL